MEMVLRECVDESLGVEYCSDDLDQMKDEFDDTEMRIMGVSLCMCDKNYCNGDDVDELVEKAAAGSGSGGGSGGQGEGSGGQRPGQGGGYRPSKPSGGHTPRLNVITLIAALFLIFSLFN